MTLLVSKHVGVAYLYNFYNYCNRHLCAFVGGIKNKKNNNPLVSEKNFQDFVDTESLLPCPQQPSTHRCRKSDYLNPRPLVFKSLETLIYAYVFQVIFTFSLPHQNILCSSLPLHTCSMHRHGILFIV